MLAVLLAFQVALPVALPANGDSASTRTAADSTLWAQIDSLTHAFLLDWRTDWGETQRHWPPEHTWRNGMTGDWHVGSDLRSGQLRLLAVHCHFAETPLQLKRRVIDNSTAAQASCPTWYPPGLPALDDERLHVDNGLERRLRPRVRAQRTALREFLERAAGAMPADVRLTGQRVRFALDAGALRDAWGMATSCTAAGPDCDLLRGLVLHRGGFSELADSVFLAAASRMDEAQRCAWNDVGVLLEPESRKRYAAMDCAKRADVEARLWWLADPLFLEPGNERRAEHFARRTLMTLLEPLGEDGRLRFRPEKGGEAVIETLVRYGWPSQFYWAGPFIDGAHDGWMLLARADTAPPYVVPEYTPDRLHVVPRFAAILSPFESGPGEWQLNAPGDPYDWWPVEHYARDRGGIMQLPEGQTATLRRRDAARFLWAGDLEPGLLARTRGDTVRATLFASHGVGEVRSTGAFAARVGGALVVDIPLHVGPALIGIELPGDSVRPAARTRFGTTIPEPLSALGQAQALSPPILFEPPDDVTTTVSDRYAVARMYGTTRFNRLSRVGVYWEGYGFGVSDTVEVELRVERQDQPGIVGRFIGVLGIGHERHASGALRWSDMPGAGRAIQIQEGDVPVQMRNVTVDLSGLARGTYRLTLSMKTQRRQAVSSERMFEMR